MQLYPSINISGYHSHYQWKVAELPFIVQDAVTTPRSDMSNSTVFPKHRRRPSIFQPYLSRSIAFETCLWLPAAENQWATFQARIVASGLRMKLTMRCVYFAPNWHGHALKSSLYIFKVSPNHVDSKMTDVKSSDSMRPPTITCPASHLVGIGNQTVHSVNCSSPWRSMCQRWNFKQSVEESNKPGHDTIAMEEIRGHPQPTQYRPNVEVRIISYVMYVVLCSLVRCHRERGIQFKVEIPVNRSGSLGASRTRSRIQSLNSTILCGKKTRLWSK